MPGDQIAEGSAAWAGAHLAPRAAFARPPA
jgi:hypothetical protein